MDGIGRLQTAAEVAERLGYTERYVWRLGREGTLPRIKVPGRKYVRFSEADGASSPAREVADRRAMPPWTGSSGSPASSSSAACHLRQRHRRPGDRAPNSVSPWRQPGRGFSERIKSSPRGADRLDVSTRILRLRRDDRCVSCGRAVPPGAQARWDADARTVTCYHCVHGAIQVSTPAPGAPPSPATAPPRGIAGASALREYERRKDNREQRTRARHPRVGGLLLALREAPQTEIAFRQGALGEAAVAASLEKRTAGSPAVLLYDRRMPGGHGNVDLLAVAPTGVYVIDAKAHKGKVSITTPPIGKPRLLIAGRDSSALLDGLDRQVDAVRAALGPMAVPSLQGVLCFTQADLPLLGRTVRSHRLLYRKQLAKRVNADGPWTREQINRAAAALAAALPPA